MKSTSDDQTAALGLRVIMGGFLKSWRRKLGCVTLALACMFALGWVCAPFPLFELLVSSDEGSLVVNGFVELNELPASDFNINWVIPYWSISIPLTLLSACLLLIKPRK